MQSYCSNSSFVWWCNIAIKTAGIKYPVLCSIVLQCKELKKSSMSTVMLTCCFVFAFLLIQEYEFMHKAILYRQLTT